METTEKKYLTLNDVRAYKIAFTLSNYVWGVVMKWDWFAKKHIGGQFVEAVDSISANLAEGFGRHGKKDKIKFYRYSSGSAKESFDWNEKAKVRKLLSEEDYNYIFNELQLLPKEINYQIKLTKEKLTI
ncbi:MAG: four helix bundle protein [Bacteroidetes bacterium]|nr:MAG: four helix bundle protein [Bacteroidota bacterium]